jgi:hypothetical protein
VTKAEEGRLEDVAFPAAPWMSGHDIRRNERVQQAGHEEAEAHPDRGIEGDVPADLK